MAWKVTIFRKDGEGNHLVHRTKSDLKSWGNVLGYLTSFRNESTELSYSRVVIEPDIEVVLDDKGELDVE